MSQEGEKTDILEQMHECIKVIPHSFWLALSIVGMSISGVAFYAALYDKVSGIAENEQKCEETTELGTKNNVKFAITLTIGILLIVIAGIVIFARRKKKEQPFTIPMALILSGALAIIYSISIKIKHLTNMTNIIISGTTFAVFLILTIILAIVDKSKEKTTSIEGLGYSRIGGFSF